MFMEPSCENCRYNVQYPPPHTCDICTSLDQEEDYEMWQPSSEVQIADWLHTVLELIDDSDRPDARGLVITWEKIAEKLGYNPSTLRRI